MRYFSTDVPKVINKQFDDELVIANYESGIYYSLGDSGAKIWLALKAGVPEENIIAEFIRKFPSAANIQTDIRKFIGELLTEGLIVLAEKGNEEQKPSLDGLQSFLPPTIERFDDLKELLLLDPVHDVDDAGWPVKAEDAH